MHDRGLVIAFTVSQTPDEVFKAITDVRAWWGGEFSGPTDQVGADFTYRFRDLHVSTQRVTELIPGRRVAWHVTDAHLSFLEDKSEWKGTDIVFDIVATGAGTEVRFTHVGLRPDRECYAACAQGWGQYVGACLPAFIATGAPAPRS